MENSAGLILGVSILLGIGLYYWLASWHEAPPLKDHAFARAVLVGGPLGFIGGFILYVILGNILSR